jgi:hypothetical protein
MFTLTMQELLNIEIWELWELWEQRKKKMWKRIDNKIEEQMKIKIGDTLESSVKYPKLRLLADSFTETGD